MDVAQGHFPRAARRILLRLCEPTDPHVAGRGCAVGIVGGNKEFHGQAAAHQTIAVFDNVHMNGFFADAHVKAPLLGATRGSIDEIRRKAEIAKALVVIVRQFIVIIGQIDMDHVASVVVGVTFVNVPFVNVPLLLAIVPFTMILTHHAHVPAAHRLAEKIVGAHFHLGILAGQVVGAVGLAVTANVGSSYRLISAVAALRTFVAVVVKLGANSVITQPQICRDLPVGGGNSEARGSEMHSVLHGIFGVLDFDSHGLVGQGFLVFTERRGRICTVCPG